MARITVEDCIPHIPNRFDLVLLAAERARQIERPSPGSTSEPAPEPKTVTALRELETGLWNPADMSEGLVRRMMRAPVPDEDLPEMVDAMALASEEAFLRENLASIRAGEMRRRKLATGFDGDW
ncbi:MAG: DNA-directed RNA polymerase subunit omega [Alphaproteobacteria bacterium]|nr:MAG: DNA-directed RNA polymerase subunit omega [Alphaproteobacteria bacterium]